MNEEIKIELPPLNCSDEEKEKLFAFYQSKISVTRDSWLKDIYSFLLAWTDNKENITLKTSGSTGSPKSIEVKKSTMLFSAAQSCEYFRFVKNENWLLCLPAAFIGGQMLLVRAIYVNANVWAADPKINLSLGRDYDFASMIPLQAEKYAESSHSIKRILIGGSSVPEKLELALRKIKDTRFFASYGMTETVSHIALREINGKNASGFYTPLKNILLGKDERGCLTIYNRNYSENVLITNDLVEFNSENCFRIIGRADNIINSGGLKIIPEEVEKKISDIIPQRIMLIGVPDEKSGEKPVLLIEGEKMDEGTMFLLNNYIQTILDKNKAPKEIIFIEKFAETENGKSDRKKTKENYLENRRRNL